MPKKFDSPSPYIATKLPHLDLDHLSCHSSFPHLILPPVAKSMMQDHYYLVCQYHSILDHAFARKLIIRINKFIIFYVQQEVPSAPLIDEDRFLTTVFRSVVYSGRLVDEKSSKPT